MDPLQEVVDDRRGCIGGLHVGEVLGLVLAPHELLGHDQQGVPLEDKAGDSVLFRLGEVDRPVFTCVRLGHDVEVGVGKFRGGYRFHRGDPDLVPLVPHVLCPVLPVEEAVIRRPVKVRCDYSVKRDAFGMSQVDKDPVLPDRRVSIRTPGVVPGTGYRKRVPFQGSDGFYRRFGNPYRPLDSEVVLREQCG